MAALRAALAAGVLAQLCVLQGVLAKCQAPRHIAAAATTTTGELRLSGLSTETQPWHFACLWNAAQMH